MKEIVNELKNLVCILPGMLIICMISLMLMDFPIMLLSVTVVLGIVFLLISSSVKDMDKSITYLSVSTTVFLIYPISRYVFNFMN